MKNLLVCMALCFMALIVKAQTNPVIDTTIKYCIAAKVQPVVISTNFPATDTITHLGFFTYTVVGDSTATVNWTLINQNRNIKFGDYQVTTAQYKLWDKSAEQTIKLLATFFGLTFKVD